MTGIHHALFASLLLLWPALAWAEPAGPNLPGIDLKGLEKDELEALSQLLQGGACPCNTKISIAECVEQKSCDQATQLTRFAVDKFREGFGPEQVQQAVVKKYFDEIMKFTFDLKDTPKKGAANGRVVIVEFADFECPHCALVSKILPEVIKAFPQDVTLYYKHFPLPSHTWAEQASRAAWAAGRQDKFWPMHDLIFANQSALDAAKFTAFAQELGLNLEKFKADMASTEASRSIERDKAEGVKAALTGTPSLYINGKFYYEDKTPEALKAYVEKLLATKPKK
jgi:protein-disulfide isomerase